MNTPQHRRPKAQHEMARSDEFIPQTRLTPEVLENTYDAEDAVVELLRELRVELRKRGFDNLNQLGFSGCSLDRQKTQFGLDRYSKDEFPDTIFYGSNRSLDLELSDEHNPLHYVIDHIWEDANPALIVYEFGADVGEGVELMGVAEAEEKRVMTVRL